MKITIKYSGENVTNFMRKIGYFFLEQGGEELSFVRPLQRSGYPRFHVYLSVNEKASELSLNLHLDQKKPVYRGITAHSGEYDGSVVEAEMQRIKQISEN